MSSTNMNEEHTMSNLEGKQKQIATYEPYITAVLCVDHYNDFLSESGKLWPLVKDVAEEVNLLHNLRNIVRTARGGISARTSGLRAKRYTSSSTVAVDAPVAAASVASAMSSAAVAFSNGPRANRWRSNYPRR